MASDLSQCESGQGLVMTKTANRLDGPPHSRTGGGKLMGGWREVLTPGEREEYRDRLAKSNPIYAGTTMEGINRLLDKRRGHAYVYTEMGPDGIDVAFRILLLVTPDRDDADILKVVNATPIGDYEPTQAAKILGSQVRRVLDQIGATSCFGTPLIDYGDAKLNQFFKVIPELFWEMKPEEPSTNGKVRYRFKRSLDGRIGDERFEGPAVRAGASPERD